MLFPCVPGEITLHGCNDSVVDWMHGRPAQIRLFPRGNALDTGRDVDMLVPI